MSSLLGPLCAFGSSVTWAFGSASYSRLARHHSAFAINFARATVAMPLFVLAAILSEGGLAAAVTAFSQVTLNELMWFAISIFASYGIGDVFFMWSAQSLGVPSALAIASTYPLLTAGLGSYIQGEDLSATQLVGLVITVTGVIVVILSAKSSSLATDHDAVAATDKSTLRLNRRSLGILLAFGTMLMWSINSFSNAKGAKDINPTVCNAIRMTIALGMSAGLGRIFARHRPVTLPWKDYKAMMPMFVFEAFGGSLMFVYGLSHSPLAIGSTLSSLAPVLAVPVAWLQGLEKFSITRTLGVFAAVFGLWLLLGVF